MHLILVSSLLLSLILYVSSLKSLNTFTFRQKSSVCRSDKIVLRPLTCRDALNSDRDGNQAEIANDYTPSESIVSKGDIPDDVRDMILEEMEANAPSELQIRLKLMGFNTLTYFGFALAGLIISLNIVLGQGWASDILGLNQSGDQNEAASYVDLSDRFSLDSDIMEGSTVVK